MYPYWHTFTRKTLVRSSSYSTYGLITTADSKFKKDLDWSKTTTTTG